MVLLGVEPANSGNKCTQCRYCWKYGHIATVCKADRSVCPLCSNSHIRSAHRCSNPTCPAGGNLKAVLACCVTLPLHCPNCGGQHTATSPSCPSCPRPSSRNEEVDPEGDNMDTSGGPAPPPTRPVTPDNPRAPVETFETRRAP